VRARTLLLLTLMLLAALDAAPASAQITQASSAPLGMGYSPGTVSPISNGVPIFTPGDQLWVASYSSEFLNVEVVSPSGAVVATGLLEPQSTQLLYNFSSSDQGGQWELRQGLSGSVILFTFVSNEGTSPDLTGYGLVGDGQLAMNFTLPASGAFDIGACLVGSEVPSIANASIPTGLGTGQLQLERRSGQVFVGLNGTVGTPFTFWIELYTDYSYVALGNSTVVSSDLRVASTTPLGVSPTFTNSTVDLENQIGSRTGRYEMRAYFESALGLSVDQIPLLVPDNATWVALAGCVDQVANLAPDFSVSASLALPPPSWPREIYTMYELQGVETVSVLSLGIEPARVDVVASPWGKPLTDSALAVKPEPGPDVETEISSSSTIYLLTGEYPIGLTLVLAPGVGDLFTVSNPFSINKLNVSSGEVVVRTEVDGSSVSGVSVTMALNGTQVAALSTDTGLATFYLPYGNYSVSADYKNSTAQAFVRAQNGSISSVTLDFGSTPPTGTQLLVYSLAATGLIGVTLSALVWVRAYRRGTSFSEARPRSV
jgi:hypothetical protein